MNRRLMLTIAIVGLLGILAVAGPALAANGSVTIREADERYSYSPKTVYVNVGDSVTWTNDSDAPHTVDTDSGGELESGNFNEGETFDHTFAATGTFAYHCDIHEYMTGSVIVLAAGVTPPPTSTTTSSATDAGSNGVWIALIALGAIASGGLAVRRNRTTD